MTNFPLDFSVNDVLIVRRREGKPLDREHGGPVPVVVSNVHAWQGAKRVKDMIFLVRDNFGFLEVRGYSNTVNFWTGGRFS